MGFLAHVKLPSPLSRMLIRAFAKSYSISVEEAERELHEYPSIGEFFIRNLKPGNRPIGEGIVSPVDGTLRSFGTIVGGVLPQVKGKTYSVTTFLQDETEAQKFNGGTFLNLYLSPQDYHSVHVPLDGVVRKSVHVPGKLFPVNDYALDRVNELFAVNERVISYIATETFTYALIMVGATNVGKISVVYDKFLSNRFRFWKKEERLVSYDKSYAEPVKLAKGDKIGTFHLGSSVVLLIPPLDKQLSIKSTPGTKVKLGTTLIDLP